MLNGCKILKIDIFNVNVRVAILSVKHLWRFVSHIHSELEFMHQSMNQFMCSKINVRVKVNACFTTL